MAEYTALAPLFTDIANAIRSKTGETGAITASLFPNEINSISTIKTNDGEIKSLNYNYSDYSNYFSAFSTGNTGVFLMC